MQTEKVTKPESLDNETWDSNQRWIYLMSHQSHQHQQHRDPRLYRQSSRSKLISPVSPK